MAFIKLTDLAGKDWVLNIDMISHVLPVSGEWRNGGTIFLKQEIEEGRGGINVSGKRIKSIIEKLTDE
ncbi:hypothetical protein QK345_12725 [Pseudomonas aeruginosa]|uniref:hypothetical protein n=1 Tax=Pseudomonas aeruginosa TaxID=287 RepID=UPI00232F3082|nr:hypothetical protein [Pseudomonas aeruginosa]MDI3655764.1 hypothetical protein [Pseudomonas aeruginosa]MDI3734635.1 hypothetical protein [Pseudomonas aeruginosa]HEJ5827360.1 hypothetical protein [Pseudomonas aeruginosa]HEJ5936462.1 hypothetical protein [Pseudomonas aeruginosa]HEK0120842.1 hypothetical protein [Pseudomonas aeruginosa]